MPELKMVEIAAAVRGRVDPAWGETVFRGFQFDSRSMKPGMLFFALRGAQADGHDHVQELRNVPGAGAVVRRDFAARGWKMPLLRVADPLRAAQDLAAHVRGKYGRIRYVGITGSAGKTTTKEFLHQLLSSQQRCFRAPRNWNNWIGLPFSLLQLSGREQTAVFELAMSDPGRGEIDRLAAILRPDVALLLNVFPVHLEFLKTLANAARAKGEILGHLAADSCAFVNGDQPLLRRVAARHRGRIVFFGSCPQGNDIVLQSVRREREGIRLRIDFFGIEEDFQAPLTSRAHAENLFAAIVAAQHLGMKTAEIREAVSRLRPLAGRGLMRRLGRVTLIDETYNSNPEALKRALLWVDGEKAAKKVAVLGDMLELGSDELRYHRQLGRIFAGLHFDLLLAVGRRAEALAGAARKAGYPARRIACFLDAAAAGQFLRRELDRGRDAVVLFKGSRGMALEKAIAEFSHE